MLQLLEAIQKIIKRFIVNETPFSSNLAAGQTVIPIESSRRYECGDQIVIYNTVKFNETGEGEIRTIVDIPDRDSITVDAALVDAYPQATSYTQKIVGGTFLQSVFIGKPTKMSHYPAIAINAKGKENEWFTLESTTEQYDIDIYCYTESGDYEETYRLALKYASAIENALFRSLYPLVEPYDEAILAEDVAESDTVIRIVDEDTLICGQAGWIWFESWDYLRYNRVREPLGNGVYELQFSAGRPFSAGDKIIRPRRHFYKAFPRSIQYGIINAESAVLNGAMISYSCSEEKRRHGLQTFQDPLTF